MIRNDDWQRRFLAHIEAAQLKQWHWGAHDCVSFVAASVAAQLGVRRLKFDFGKWSTARGAARVLRVRTNGTHLLSDAVNQVAQPQGLAFVQRGDVVALLTDVLPGTGTQTLGIFDGAGVLVASPNGGLLKVVMSKAQYSWAVEGFA